MPGPHLRRAAAELTIRYAEQATEHYGTTGRGDGVIGSPRVDAHAAARTEPWLSWRARSQAVTPVLAEK